MPTTQQSDDKVRELQERLVAGVEDLVNGDRWRAFIATAARFHRYRTGASDISQRCEFTPDTFRVPLACRKANPQPPSTNTPHGERQPS